MIMPLPMTKLLSVLFVALNVTAVVSEGASGGRIGESLFPQERKLQECNEELVTWSAEEVYAVVETAINEQLGDDSSEADLASFVLLPSIKYGVQVRRLCASCEDFPVDEQPEIYASFCTGYGSDTDFSGLVMIPLSEDESFLPGTHPGSIFCHGTSTRDVPTTLFDEESSPVDIIANVAIAATGAVMILPDYMGYGESSGEIYKGYLVKQQYQTSIVPLWLMTEKIISEESNCTTALADAVAIVGYSEGGYAAVAVAEAMDGMGVNIIKVEAGGGPYRMGSAALLKGIEATDNGSFPLEVRHYFALVGAAYSSTYEDLPNFDQSQDMFNDDYREYLVDLITSSSSTEEVQEGIPIDDPLSVMNLDLVEFARAAIADGDEDPCNSDRVVEGVHDKLCEALLSNDLTLLLETTPYPVRLCHSPDDEVVFFANLPDIAQNGLLEVYEASGTHYEAGVVCLLQATLFMFGTGFQQAEFEAKDLEDGCPVVTPSPSFASEAPTRTPAPTVSPSPTKATPAPTEYAAPCGEVLSSWSASEAKSLLSQTFSDMFGEDSQEYALFQLSLDSLEYGVQVRKMCASCDEFTVSSSYDEYCGTAVYGYGANHSGLVMIPMTSDGTALAVGTYPGFIYNHEPTVRRVPSRDWDGANSMASEIIFGVLPAATGAVTILPDFFGHGETNDMLFKAFLVKQAYQTSIVPLWLKTAAVLEEESNCTALGDAVTVAGFNEGGYASVVVADALHKLGVEIIRVQAGAVPARLGSVLIPKLVESMDEETFPVDYRFVLALLGSAYSASFPDLQNFEEGAYLLKSEVRDEIVDIITKASSLADLDEVVPRDDPLSILDRGVLMWARDAIKDGDIDPCGATDLVEGFRVLCDTLSVSDLTDILENAAYDVFLCHSPDDNVVSIANLPDDTNNSNLTISLVSGTHADSSSSCKSRIITFLQSPLFTSYPVVAKHDEDACEDVSVEGSGTGPTASPAGGPAASSTTSTSSALKSTVPLFLSFLCGLVAAIF